MIFDSLGIGEIGVIVVLMILLIEPKKVGHYLKRFNDFRKKISKFQGDVRQQINTLVSIEDQKASVIAQKGSKAEFRNILLDRIRSLPAFDRSEAARQIVDRLTSIPAYQNAQTIACFVGAIDEIDTENILQRILTDGKKLLLPFIRVLGAEKTMGMAMISDLEKDLVEGSFRLLEPAPHLWPEVNAAIENPDLILIPACGFDIWGGRIGKGMGFYDRYLSSQNGLKIGIGFDVQILDKKLPLEPHDQAMDMIVSEKRSLILSKENSV